MPPRSRPNTRSESVLSIVPPLVRLWILRLLVPLGGHRQLIGQNGYLNDSVADALGLDQSLDAFTVTFEMERHDWKPDCENVLLTQSLRNESAWVLMATVRQLSGSFSAIKCSTFPPAPPMPTMPTRSSLGADAGRTAPKPNVLAACRSSRRSIRFPVDSCDLCTMDHDYDEICR